MTQYTGDALRDLTQSTLEFYKRFDVQPEVNSTIQNFREEVTELIEAAQQGSDKDHIAEEAADVFVTAIGVCYASGVDVEKLIEQLYKVVAKNDAKTHETHAYSDGKIRRRQG
jgi:NTP pyrophosphatase (non-canonical NTP hydrolase)